MRIPSGDFRYIGIDDEGDTSASYEGEVSDALLFMSSWRCIRLTPRSTSRLHTAINHSPKTCMAASPHSPSKRPRVILLPGITLTIPLPPRSRICWNGVPSTKRMPRARKGEREEGFIQGICHGSQPRWRRVVGAGNKIEWGPVESDCIDFRCVTWDGFPRNKEKNDCQVEQGHNITLDAPGERNQATGVPGCIFPYEGSRT